MENEIITIDNLPEVLKCRTLESQKKSISQIYDRFSKTIKAQINPVLKVITQVPIIRNALKVEKGFKALIPPEYLEGLKDGSLKLMEGKDGSLISTIVKTDGGEIVHQLRLEEFSKLANPAELSKFMNQASMQLQLDEIQKKLVDFRIEINQKLDEIIHKMHSDRMIPTDAVKNEFLRFQEGLSNKERVLSKISDAQAAAMKEIEDSLYSINKYNNEDSITSEENYRIQEKISYIIDSINSLRHLYLIETFFSETEQEQEKICKIYLNSLSSALSKENLLLIDAYSDFSTLGLTENIWENELAAFSDNLLPLKQELLKLENYV